MKSMNTQDLNWCKRRLPNLVAQCITDNPIKVSVGGGFIRSCISGEPINDIDMFVDSIETCDKVVQFLRLKKEPIQTKNAFTILGYKHPVQIIHRWKYEHPEHILNDFDFSITCAVMWYDGVWRGQVHDTYYEDLAAKRLRYLSPKRDEDVGGSVLRVLKYYRKGYNITLRSYAGVISRLISKLEVKDMSDEKHVSKILTGLLVEVDPNAFVEDQITREEAK